MRLPARLSRWFLRPRLWTIMILVAALAVGLAWKRRWDHCQRLARLYGDKSKLYRALTEIDSDQIAMWRNSMGPEVNPPVLIDLGELERREAFRDANREHARLYDVIRLRFERAALNPFLSLPSVPGRAK